MYQHHQQTDLIGHITFHEQLNVNNKNRNIQTPETKRVYILHTGGTIGMFPNLQNKFAPVAQKFKEFLVKYPYFCDEDQTYFKSKDDFLITPPSVQGQNIWYKFQELKELIDSTNMSFQRYNFILEQIQKVYEDYDAFVILHGTDTMSYTASAISFMIQNLKKPVVFTGAKIPIGQTRNDACNNLLCALTIAGHYSIPQVLIVFDNKVLRGNRTNKYSTSSFQFFRTPNFYPLGQLGLTVTIKWQKILSCNHELPTKFVPLTQEVEIIRLSPYGFLTPPSSRYVIVQSFGDGNVPTQGPIYAWLKKNSELPEDERKIIVNISQVYQSVIKNIYETGEMANKLGMISGSDMTCEAAIAKLSYLISKNITQYQEIKQMMQMNLRGELTEEQDRTMKHKQNYTVNSMMLLQRHFQKRTTKQKDILLNIIQEGLVVSKPSKSSLSRLIQFGYQIHKKYPDNTNILHHLMTGNVLYSNNDINIVLDYLLCGDIDLNLVDQHGNSALFYAIQNHLYQSASKIKEADGKLVVSMERLLKAIQDNQLQLLHCLSKFQYDFKIVDGEGRNCLFYAVIWKKQDIISFFKNFTDLFEEQNLMQKDIYGIPLKLYIEKFGREIIELLEPEESEESNSVQKQIKQKQ